MRAVQRVTSLSALAGQFDAVVFDQWGVLHNGSTAYPGAIAAVRALAGGATPLAVLSNSGKRSLPNRNRIASMGFPGEAFAVVMTSGEALWLDLKAERYPEIRRLFAITAAPGDEDIWAEGLHSLSFSDNIGESDAILLMGLPDNASGDAALKPVLARALECGLPMFCSNPDKASPREGGGLVRSPGAMADAFRRAGGTVFFYGKPHRAVFESLQRQFNMSNPARLLMIGDSIEHDIAGAAAAGWHTLLIEGGLHAADLAGATETGAAIARLCNHYQCPLPDFHMEHLAS